MRKFLPVIIFASLSLFIFAFFFAKFSLAVWFQTYVGDVHSQGSITANVPSGNYFSRKDSSIGDSGIVSYKNLSSNFGSGRVSETNNSWNVNSADWPQEDNKYGYEYFKNKFSSPQSFGNTLQGVACNTVNGVYTVTGDLTVGSTCRIDGGRKVIFLVSRNLNVNNKMEVANNSFLAFIVSGDIQIANNRRGSLSNPDVQGVYIADGQIKTGSGGNQLYAGGIFVGWGGFSLQRTGGASDPREVFIYRPDLLLNMPKEMKEERFAWREVAP